MIAPTAIVRGVGITLQMDIVEVEGTTGYYDSDLNAKARKAAEKLKGDYDFGFVHVKATDDAGHDKDHQIKVEQFEKCDRMIQTFIDQVKDDSNEYIIVVTGDHTTPTQIGDHTYEPVPITMSYVSSMYGETPMPKDDVQVFDEMSCQKGMLGRFPGIYTIPTILKYKEKFSL